MPWGPLACRAPGPGQNGLASAPRIADHSLPLKNVEEIPALPPRPRDAHKGSMGTVGVLAGSAGMLGAAILCARGALRGGAGLCRVCLPAELMAPFTVAVPAATTLARSPDFAGLGEGAAALVIGPGLGQAPELAGALLHLLGRRAAPAVLDADALNVLAPLSAHLPGELVLTPHPGEAGRLLGTDAAAVQADRPAALAELCRRSGQVVVLKGQASLVGDGARCFCNRTGNPGMATGGSGDVLAGLIAALLAQGMAPFEAACLGVHLHGKAGDLVAARLSEPGLCAEDLPLAIAEVMA